MTNQMCSLCHQVALLRNSHVIPAFVYKTIKNTSFTGGLRNPNSPNRRIQDGDTQQLLCDRCESKLSWPEREFNNRIFSAFTHNDECSFAYGPWLHQFLVGLSWRTLVLDLPEILADVAAPAELKYRLTRHCESSRLYLLGDTSLATELEQHLVFFTTAASGAPDLAGGRPNVMIRRSAFGYTLFDRSNSHCAVVNNLAGAICVARITKHPREQWDGSLVVPHGGTLAQPTTTSSWVMGDVMSYVTEFAEDLRSGISDGQLKKIVEDAKLNPHPPSKRFFEADEAYRPSEPPDHAQ